MADPFVEMRREMLREYVAAIEASVPADPVPAPEPSMLRIELWSDGTLQIERDTVGGAADLVLFTPDETREIVRYLNRMAVTE